MGYIGCVQSGGYTATTERPTASERGQAVLEYCGMAGSIEAKSRQVEYLSASHRKQVELEEQLRTGVHIKAFDDQLRLRTAINKTQANTIKWEIWDEFVWTAGYVDIYADIRKRLKTWQETLIAEARTDYGFLYGIYALRTNEEHVRSQVLADLPKRMNAVAARAKVRASRGYGL
jgi:hypothetical protein